MHRLKKTMTKLHTLSSLTLLLHVFFFLSNHATGFQVRLIHRESPTSPFYSPKETKSQRIGRAVGRTAERASHFDKKMNKRDNSGAEITTNSGEYLLNMAIGSPPVEIMAIADTGSDLVWTQCKPCEECYEQRAPLFDPSASSTYATVPCESATCTGLPSAGCGGEGGSCEYSMQYGDNSFTQGTLSVDVMKLGSASLPRGVFGCGFQNGGTFNENGSGIIGLGGGPFSATRQFTSFMHAKFSYCLRPWLEEGDSSPMRFGEDAEVGGEGKVSTPMVSKDPNTFYYLTLKSITVEGGGGGEVKEEEEEEEVEEGNIIIDSGTTVTILPPKMYSQLEADVMDAIKLERGEDPKGRLSLCYKGNMSSFDAPPITAHFHGADLPLTPLNTFFQYSDSLLCLSFVPGTPNGVAIFGNLAQINMEVEYDLREMTVSFKPANCSML